MKTIIYKICEEINVGTAENPMFKKTFVEKGLDWSEANEKIAKREAYNGEYTIEDDGRVEPVPVETTDDVLNALLGVSE